MLRHCCILCCLLFAEGVYAQDINDSTDIKVVRYEKFTTDTFNDIHNKQYKSFGQLFLYIHSLKDVAYYNDCISKILPQYAISTILYFQNDSFIKASFMFNQEEISCWYSVDSTAYYLNVNEVSSNQSSVYQKDGFELYDLSGEKVFISFDKYSAEDSVCHFVGKGLPLLHRTLPSSQNKKTIKTYIYSPSKDSVDYKEYWQEGELSKEGRYYYSYTVYDTLSQLNPITLIEEQVVRKTPIYKKSNDWKVYQH